MKYIYQNLKNIKMSKDDDEFPPECVGLLFAIGGIVLLVFGAVNINKFTAREDIVCVVVSSEIVEGESYYGSNLVLEVLSNFTIQEEPMQEFLIVDCDGRGECRTRQNDYSMGTEYDCIWYENIQLLSIYDKFLTEAIVMIAGGIVLAIGCCGLTWYCFVN